LLFNIKERKNLRIKRSTWSQKTRRINCLRLKLFPAKKVHLSDWTEELTS
jgi:hypothetical protein